MSDTVPSETDLDALAASLHADARDSTVFFAVLCDKLLDVLPANTAVERAHSVFKRRRLARKVTVQMGEETFEADLAAGSLTCRHIHSVHGVGGGMPWSKQLSAQEWLRALVGAMSREAQTSAAAASALRSLVT
jgi:hypothetical protein